MDRLAKRKSSRQASFGYNLLIVVTDLLEMNCCDKKDESIKKVEDLMEFDDLDTVKSALKNATAADLLSNGSSLLRGDISFSFFCKDDIFEKEPKKENAPLNLEPKIQPIPQEQAAKKLHSIVLMLFYFFRLQRTVSLH